MPAPRWQRRQLRGAVRAGIRAASLSLSIWVSRDTDAADTQNQRSHTPVAIWITPQATSPPLKATHAAIDVR